MNYEETRAREIKLEEQRKAKEKRLAREIAQHLGEPWQANIKTNDDGQYRRSSLIGEEYHEIYLHLSPYHAKGRLVLYATFPHGKRPNWYYGPREKMEITVDEDREPEEIANEIRRRLLPKYLPAITKAVTEMLNHEGQEIQRDYQYREFIKALGAGEIINATGDNPEIRVYRHQDSPLYEMTHLEASAYRGHSLFTLKIDASFELAVDIAKLIRRHDTRKRTSTAEAPRPQGLFDKE
jgi:hypothetical protein